jgi:hypothetical protein
MEDNPMKCLKYTIPMALLLSVWATAGLAAQPYGDVSDIVDLQGVPAEQAETELANRGYKRVIREAEITYWWNEKTRTCAGILMTGGSVTEVESVQLSSCDR